MKIDMDCGETYLRFMNSFLGHMDWIDFKSTIILDYKTFRS